MVKHTGKTLSAEHLAEAKKRSAEVRDTPVARVHGRWLHEDARESFMTWVDKLAEEYGLPAPGKIDGEVNHYGIAPNGEFTTYVED